MDMDKIKYESSKSRNKPRFEKLQYETVDSLLTKAGGWGPLQWRWLIFALLAIQGPNIYLYGLAYAELLPRLLCTSDGIEYHEWGMGLDQSSNDVGYEHQKEMCIDGNLISHEYWKIDYTSRRSLHNWMTHHELYCEPRFYIGLFGSMIFMGFACWGLLLKISDYLGRIFLIRIGAFVQLVIFIAFLFVNDYRYYYMLLLILGFLNAKQLWLYIYSNEISPEKHQILMSCLVCVFDSSVISIFSSLYFIFGGKYWNHLAVLAPILLTITFVFSFFVPESPKYLHAKGMYNELAKVIDESARLNKNTFSVHDNLVSLINQDATARSEDKEVNSANSSKSKSEYSIWEDLKQFATLKNLSISVCLYWSISFKYYMMSLYMKYIGGDVMMNILFTGICEIIANIFTYIMVNKFGLRVSFVICSFICIIFGFLLLFDMPGYLIGICVVCARFGVQAEFPMLHYYNNIGIFNPLFVPFLYLIGGFWAKMWTVLAPQVAEMPKPIPMMTYLIVSVIMLVSILFMRR